MRFEMCILPPGTGAFFFSPEKAFVGCFDKRSSPPTRQAIVRYVVPGIMHDATFFVGA